MPYRSGSVPLAVGIAHPRPPSTAWPLFLSGTRAWTPRLPRRGTELPCTAVRPLSCTSRRPFAFASSAITFSGTNRADLASRPSVAKKWGHFRQCLAPVVWSIFNIWHISARVATSIIVKTPLRGGEARRFTHSYNVFNEKPDIGFRNVFPFVIRKERRKVHDTFSRFFYVIFTFTSLKHRAL